MNSRIKYVDIAKALAIFFIVFGHCIVHSKHLGSIFNFLYSFHVVLFFILSGITFNSNNKNFKEFIIRKIKRIIIPYFIWSFLFLIPYFLFGLKVGTLLGSQTEFSFKQILYNIIYGSGANNALKQNTSLWFLPTLFSMEIFFYFIDNLKNKNNYNNLFCGLFLLFVSIINSYFFNYNIPFGINNVLNLGIFFYFGTNINKFDLINKINLWQLIFVFLIGFCGYYFNSPVSIVDYEYGNIILLFFSGCFFSIFFIKISTIINNSKFLEWVGKSTMEILIFHKLFVIVFQTKLGVISKLLISSNYIIELFFSIIISIISIIFSLIIGYIIKNTIPSVLGYKGG